MTMHKNKYIILLLVLVSFLVTNTYAQKKEKRQIDVSGIVKSETAQAIEGATIFYNMGRKSVISDATEDDMLIVKKAEFCEVTENVKKVMEITLKEAGLLSDQVELPHNKKTTQHDVTAPVTIITGEELSRYPSRNILEALAGKIPSGKFLTSSYAPGNESVSMRIRNMEYGTIVDGIARPLTDLTADEIESITILRGMSARAMYGYDAGPGLIVVKTKRGKQGTRNVSVNVEYGAKMTIEDKLPRWLSSYDYARLYNEAAENDNINAPYSEDDLNGYAQGNSLKYPDEDIYAQYFNNSMEYKRANLQLSGGSKGTNYFMNFNYLGSGNGWLKEKEKNYNQLRLRSNVDVQISEDFRLSVDALGSMTFQKDPLDIGSVWNVLSSYPPNAYPVAIKADTFGMHPSYPINPVANLYKRDVQENIYRAGQMNLRSDYDFSKFLEGLKAEAYLTYDLYNTQRFATKNGYQFPLYESNWLTDVAGNDSLSLISHGTEEPAAGKSKTSDSYALQAGAYFNISYTNSFDKHDVAGRVNYFLQYARKKGVVQDFKRQNVSFTGNYAYDKKYYVDLILQYMGTMGVVEANRFKLFPTVGMGWIMSKEDFFSPSFVDLLKLRTSYGSMGVYDGSRNFLYRTEYRDNGSLQFGTEGNTQNNKTIYMTQYGNPGLDWGTIKEFDAGIDALFFNKRLTMQIDYYHMTHSGLVQNAMSPDILGVLNYYANIAENKYSGIDGAVHFSDHSGDFSYSLGFNAGYNNSEKVKDNNPDYEYEWMNRTGNPTDAIYGLVAQGLFKDETEIASSPIQTFGDIAPGNIKYENLNAGDDNIIESLTDSKMIGHSNPRFIYGADINLGYKGFELFVLGYGVSKRDIDVRNNNYYHADSKDKYSQYVLDNRFQTSSPSVNALHPRLTTMSRANDNQRSSYWLKNGAFFKIKNVELAYSFSDKIANKLLLPNLRLFIKGANLATFSKIEELDPESLNMGVSTYPSMRTFTGGLSIKF